MSDTQSRSLQQQQRALIALQALRAKLEEVERVRREPIAVVGIGCRYPAGIESAVDFWGFLTSGADAICEVPESRREAWLSSLPARCANQPAYIRGGFLHNALDQLDCSSLQIAPKEASSLSPEQRLLLEVGWEAIDDAGIAHTDVVGSRTGVFVGAYTDDFQSLQLHAKNFRAITPYSFVGSAGSVLSGRLSYLFGFEGPSVTIDTACSSSLVAVHLAIQALRAGECEMALAGGVNVVLTPHLTHAMHEAGALSPDARCWTFDARANGYVRGEGCGVLVLKRLSDAEEASDRIYAVLRGSGVNNDGRSSSLTAPNGRAQEAVIRRALQSAGLESSQIRLIEAHGTGTALGDPIEVDALTAVYGTVDRTNPLWISSLKTNFGHLEGAAGIAGLTKLVLQLYHGRIVSHINYERPNPGIDLNGRSLEIPIRTQDWAAPARIGAVSAFGMSGTNAHIIAENYVGPALPGGQGVRSPYAISLSSRTPGGLLESCKRWERFLSATQPESLARIAYTSLVRRTHYPYRLTVAGTRERIIESLREFSAAHAELPDGLRPIERESPSIAFVFNGQGTQWAGMGGALYERLDAFRTFIDSCESVLPDNTPWSARSLICDPQMDLRATERAQPALFLLQAGLFRVFQACGVSPHVSIGHSVGELAAAYVTGRLTLKDAVFLAIERGRQLQAATGAGAMVVTELTPDAGLDIARRCGAQVALAAHNAPRSSVFAGTLTDIETFTTELGRGGYWHKRMNVDYAFHTPQLAPYANAFRERIARLAPEAGIGLMVSTMNASPVDGNSLGPDYWASQIVAPVRFEGAVRAAIAAGATLFVEIGGHGVLHADITATAGAPAATISTFRRDRDLSECVAEALAALHTRGVRVEWRRLFPSALTPVSIPTYAWIRDRHWPGEPRSISSRVDALIDSLVRPLVGDISVIATCTFDLDAPEHQFFREHRVRDEIWFPGAGFLEFAVEVGAHAFHAKGVRLRDVDLLVPLVLGSSAQTIQLIGTRTQGGIEFKICSGSAEEAVIHVTGTMEALSTVGAPGEIRTPSGNAPTKQLYEDLAKVGLQYGQSFQTITELHGDRESGTARLALSATGGFRLDPRLLDGAIQCLVATTIGSPGAPIAGGEPWVPAHLDVLDCYSGLHSDALCATQIRSRTETRVKGDVAVVSQTGTACATLQGLSLARLPASVARRGDLTGDRRLFSTEWKRLSAPQSTTRARDWIFIVDNATEWLPVATSLEAAKQRVRVVRPSADLSQAATGLAAPILVFSMTPNLAGHSHWSEENITAYATALRMVQWLSRSGIVGATILFVTRSPVPSRSAHDSADYGWFWGFAASLTHEFGEFSVRLVDTDSFDNPLLTDELLNGGDEDRVALRGGARMVPRLRPLMSAKRSPSAPEFGDGAVLITGGLGGLGLATAQWLCSQGARNILLASRSKPSPDVEGQLVQLRASGANVVSVQCDIGDRRKLETAVASLAAYPPIRTVFHTAGVLADAAVHNQSPSKLLEVLHAKVAPVRWFPQLFPELRNVILFSSCLGTLGAPGQANYAAANAYLDALAHELSSDTLRVVSLGWGPWASVGMAARGDRRAANLAAQGYAPLSPGDALTLMATALATEGHHFLVMDFATRSWRQSNVRASRTRLLDDIVDVQGDAPKAGILDALRTMDAERAREALQDYLQKAVANIAQLPLSRVTTSVTFKDLGFDSLMVMSLRNQLDAEGIQLSTASLYANATLPGLTDFIANKFGSKQPINDKSPIPSGEKSQSVIPADGDALARELAEIANLGVL